MYINIIPVIYMWLLSLEIHTRFYISIVSYTVNDEPALVHYAGV